MSAGSIAAACGCQAIIRRRDGAYHWAIFCDTEVADRYLEIFLVHSWAEHLGQHERQTQADREVEGEYKAILPVSRRFVT